MNNEFVTLSDEQLEAVAGAHLSFKVDVSQSNWAYVSQSAKNNSASASASASSEGDQHHSKFGSWDATASATANSGNIASVNQNNLIASGNN